MEIRCGCFLGKNAGDAQQLRFGQFEVFFIEDELWQCVTGESESIS